MVADLGPVSEMRQPTGELTDAAATVLYPKLFAPFAEKASGAKTDRVECGRSSPAWMKAMC